MVLENPSLQSKAGRALRLHGHKVSWDELCDYVLDLIQNEKITQTNLLSARLGKTVKQTRRIIKKMAEEERVSLGENGRLQKSAIAIKQEQYQKLTADKFAQIPQIKRWLENLTCKPRSIYCYKNAVQLMFDEMKTSPASVLVSKQATREFWKNFKKHNDIKRGINSDHGFRTGYRSLLDEFDFHVTQSEGRKIGLMSSHDSYQKYAGAVIPSKIVPEIGQMMIEAGDIDLFVWLRTGVRTGGRSGALATMTWNRIVLDEDNFEVSQHETKDARGDVWLNEDGEWQTKYPPLDLLKILQFWKNHPDSPKNSHFVWFEDKGNDLQNRKEAAKVLKDKIPRLKIYLRKFYDRFDGLTREYAEKDPGHLLRHTFAQLLKDEGSTKDEIKIAGHWKSDETVNWYVGASKDEKKKIRASQEKIKMGSDAETKLLSGV